MNQGKLEVVKWDDKSEHRHSRNQQINGLGWVNLTQMTIIYTTVGKNLLEEMEWPS